VLIGTYRLSAEKEGFRALQVDDLTVEVGQTATLTLTLTVGDVRNAVTVDAPSSGELDSDSNTLRVVVDSRRVQELPLNGREFLRAGLQPGEPAQQSFRQPEEYAR
jgi:hypothetical protein